ncbi:MAG: LysR substrate-binding domain-containing protein [Burkholderiaceae bacterium]|nr:LysR substrate-binding domain-containing protein [Burkholderiaceae bacterium]
MGDETYGTWHLKKGQEQEFIKVRANLSTNDGSAALAWAIDGHGILLRSQWDVGTAIRQKQLVPILSDWTLPAADIYVVFQNANQMPAKIRALADLLVEEFKPYRRKGKEPLGAW